MKNGTSLTLPVTLTNTGGGVGMMKAGVLGPAVGAGGEAVFSGGVRMGLGDVGRVATGPGGVGGIATGLGGVGGVATGLGVVDGVA